MLVRDIYGKGQVVIPKHLRDLLGIAPGSKVAFGLEGDRITVRRAGAVHEVLAGIAAAGPSISEVDLDRAHEEAIEERHRGMLGHVR